MGQFSAVRFFLLRLVLAHYLGNVDINKLEILLKVRKFEKHGMRQLWEAEYKYIPKCASLSFYNPHRTQLENMGQFSAVRFFLVLLVLVHRNGNVDLRILTYSYVSGDSVLVLDGIAPRPLKKLTKSGGSDPKYWMQTLI
ncbi:hypothetical protein ACLOJK_031156 [Asimina triloba]